MAQFIVTNVFDGANMRKTPSASGQLIRNLPFGTRLERIADTPGNFKEMPLSSRAPPSLVLFDREPD